MAWADVAWGERWDGIDSFFKLLVIPLLLMQFRNTDRGQTVLAAYLVSCAALMLLSSAIAVWPGIYQAHLESWQSRHDFAVPAKNAATQSDEFVTCIAGVLYLTTDAVNGRRWVWLAVILLIIVGMTINIAFVATGRTALVIMPILLVIFAFRTLSIKSSVILLAAGVLLAAGALSFSPYLRGRTTGIWHEYQLYRTEGIANSSGERLEFWKKSIGFVSEAPLFGHGTGSIHSLFERASEGKSGAAGSDTTNPHNQTLAVAIQIGLVGAAALWTMWIAHLLLFRGGGLAGWVGTLVVVQNIIGSVFNSHLFDFTQGWVYVFGVGVAGGMVLRQRALQAQSPANANEPH
jgi:MFS family permease